MLFDESQCSILSDEKTTTDDESLNKYKESNLKFKNLSANVASSFKTPVLKTSYGVTNIFELASKNVYKKILNNFQN